VAIEDQYKSSAWGVDIRALRQVEKRRRKFSRCKSKTEEKKKNWVGGIKKNQPELKGMRCSSALGMRATGTGLKIYRWEHYKKVRG